MKLKNSSYMDFYHDLAKLRKHRPQQGGFSTKVNPLTTLTIVTIYKTQRKNDVFKTNLEFRYRRFQRLSAQGNKIPYPAVFSAKISPDSEVQAFRKSKKWEETDMTKRHIYWKSMQASASFSSQRGLSERRTATRIRHSLSASCPSTCNCKSLTIRIT